MQKTELIIGVVVNSPKDLKRMKVTELRESTACLVSLDGMDRSERSYEDLQPIIFHDNRVFQALGFTDRELTTGTGKIKDKIVQLEGENGNFVTITVTDNPDPDASKRWFAEIKDRNFQPAGSSVFNFVHELQSIVKLITGLDFKVNL